MSDYRYDTAEDHQAHPGVKHVEGGYPTTPNLKTGVADVDDAPRTYQPAQVRDDRSSIAMPGSEGSTNPADLQREMYGSNRDRGLATLGVGRASRRNAGPEVDAANAARGARKTVARLLELPDSPVLRHFPEISQAKIAKAREALEDAAEKVEAAAGALERVYPEHRAAVEAHVQAVEEAVLAGKEEPTLELPDPAISMRTARARLGSLVTLADRARKAFEEALAEAERAMDKPVSEGFAQTWETAAAKVVEAAAAVEKLAVASDIAVRYRVERSGGELTRKPLPVRLDAVAKVLRDQAELLAVDVPELTDMAMEPSRPQREQMANHPTLCWQLAVMERRENFKKTSFTVSLGKNLPPGIEAQYGDAARAEGMDPSAFWRQ